MKTDEKLKMYTLRHFLFYMGVTCVVFIPLGFVLDALAWSYGANFAIIATIGLAISFFGMREGLFAPAKPSKTPHQPQHHA